MNNTLTAKQKAYVGLVKLLNCSVCDAEGPSDAHHFKQHRQYTVVALCKSCHQGTKMGWHGEKRAWAIAKMDEIDALNVTVERVIDLLKSG
jgi:transcription elongation factor Elf1